MNYIMGFLYLSYRNEEISFKVFCKLIINYFDNMFSKDMLGLKKLFYEFEKCLMLYMPELANHFNVKLKFKNYLNFLD